MAAEHKNGTYQGIKLFTVDSNLNVGLCSGEWGRGGGVARSPSHESVTTDLSLFSVSSAASDARVLKLLASKAGQGPDPNARVASPNPEGKTFKRPPLFVPLSEEPCCSLLAGCAALCSQMGIGMRRAFSAGDISNGAPQTNLRSAISEVGIIAAIEALTMRQASRSCSTWVAVGGSQLPSPQRSGPCPPQGRRQRQHYIRRRLMCTYRALERMSRSEFNLDKLEEAAKMAATACASSMNEPVATTVTVPPYRRDSLHPDTAHLVLTAADVERERGRPLSKYERNMMIFNWLHTLDEAAPF